VAAIKVPELFQGLRQHGHTVKVVATGAALYFFDPAALTPERSAPLGRDPETVILDQDEWPGREQGQHYQRTDRVLHIDLRRWADLLLIAPLDANTLAKLACGLADNCLTCVWRAWDPARPVLLAPSMNTLMWQHPATGRHLRQLAEDAGVTHLTTTNDWLMLIEEINQRCPQLQIVPPQSKRLACDDVGLGAMAEVVEIVAVVEKRLSLTSTTNNLTG
jgi:phosphopantothenoylcysteine decarboxylase